MMAAGKKAIKFGRGGEGDQLTSTRDIRLIHSLHLVFLEQPDALQKGMGFGFRTSHRPLDEKTITAETALVFERIALLLSTSA